MIMQPSKRMIHKAGLIWHGILVHPDLAATLNTPLARRKHASLFHSNRDTLARNDVPDHLAEQRHGCGASGSAAKCVHDGWSHAPHLLAAHISRGRASLADKHE